jgi:cbb3-type cytochrome oxidase cytochrome c subunit
MVYVHHKFGYQPHEVPVSKEPTYTWYLQKRTETARSGNCIGFYQQFAVSYANKAVMKFYLKELFKVAK